MNHKEFKNVYGGFTLIELLIVVVVIGILSGAVLSVLNVNVLRQKARDSQRIGDLGRIRSALELYYNDNRSYPTSATTRYSQLSGGKCTAGVNNDYVSSFLTAYINPVPYDPQFDIANCDKLGPCNQPEKKRYNYMSDLAGSRYVLTAMMEYATSNDGNECELLKSFSDTTVNPSCPASVGIPGNFASSEYCFGYENPL